MSFKHHGNLTHYSHRTTPAFSEAELGQLTPEDVVKYMNFSTYETATPEPEARPLNWRSDTAEFAKKAISHYMPSTGSWNQAGSHGNPTRSRQVQQFISTLKRKQVRQLGRPCAAKRDMTLAEFKLAAKILEEQDDWNCNRWLQAMRMQFHMIGRGDDVHHMETKSLRVHPQFKFALQTKMRWSKNVLEERDCPPQILLGAANPVFCIILSLAIYLEERFSSYGTHSRFLYTEDVNDSAPKRAVKSYSRTVRETVFLNASFQALSSVTGGSLGMHSFRKFPATWASILGATQDEVDARGRWKRGQGRTSTRYINPSQPYADAKVCGLLCVDGPVMYSLKNGCGVSALFLHEHVCPRISEFFGDGEGAAVVEVLGTALLWSCFNPHVQGRVPQFILDRVKTEYGSIRPVAFHEDVNPVERLRLVIYRVGESLQIDELPPAPTGDGDEDDGQQGNGDHPTDGGAMAAAAQPHVQQGMMLETAGRQQFVNHMTAQLHGIISRLTRLEEQVNSSAGDLKMDIQRQLASLNKNMKRLQLMPTARRQGGGGVNGNENGPLAPGVRGPNVQLSKRPKDLYSLWTEYTHGLGGLKAARDFSSAERGIVKQKYYRRKTFWDVIAKHVDAGYTAPTAVDLVYQVYGRNKSVTMVINKMLEDRKRYNGSPHPRLCIRVAAAQPGQPRLPRGGPPGAAAMAQVNNGRAAAAPAAGRGRGPARPRGHFMNYPGRIVDHETLNRARQEREDRHLLQVEGEV